MRDSLLGVVVLIVILAILFVPVSLYTQWAINYWLEVAHSQKDCPFWAAVLITAITADFRLVLDVATTVCTAFIDRPATSIQ